MGIYISIFQQHNLIIRRVSFVWLHFRIIRRFFVVVSVLVECGEHFVECLSLSRMSHFLAKSFALFFPIDNTLLLFSNALALSRHVRIERTTKERHARIDEKEFALDTMMNIRHNWNEIICFPFLYGIDATFPSESYSSTASLLTFLATFSCVVLVVISLIFWRQLCVCICVFVVKLRCFCRSSDVHNITPAEPGTHNNYSLILICVSIWLSFQPFFVSCTIGRRTKLQCIYWKLVQFAGN